MSKHITAGADLRNIASSKEWMHDIMAEVLRLRHAGDLTLCAALTERLNEAYNLGYQAAMREVVGEVAKVLEQRPEPEPEPEPEPSGFDPTHQLWLDHTNPGDKIDVVLASSGEIWTLAEWMDPHTSKPDLKIGGEGALLRGGEIVRKHGDYALTELL